MARCVLCESEFPDGWPSCGACGHPLGRPVNPRSAPEPVRKAIEAARKDLVSGPHGRADLSFARALLERSEQTEAAGDLGRALDLARGARRAIDLAKRRTRVDEELARADVVLRHAREAGIETLAFERNLAAARALVAQGDLESAEKLLHRVSVRTLDQRREKTIQAIVDKAAARVKYAKERGADAAQAESRLAEAREALALREYGKIRILAAKAVESAEAGRRFARAETILNRIATEVGESRESGVNVTESRKILTHARESLRKGLFADVQRDALRARRLLREGRAYARAEAVLREAEREATREARRGADVSAAESILDNARRALEANEYAKVAALAREAYDAVRIAALLKHVQDALASLRLDAEDLARQGIEAPDFSDALGRLGEAIAKSDLPMARRLVEETRRAGESAREAHLRAARDRTLAVILANAPRGLDAAVARDLLRQVEDAISLGKQVDVQSLIDARMTEADAVTTSSLQERIMKDRDLIVELRHAAQDTLAMEGKLADAAIAVTERRFVAADGLLDSVEHDVYALRETLRGEAAESLGHAREHVHHAKEDGIPVEAGFQHLHVAEVAYGEGRYADTINAARESIAEIDTVIAKIHEDRRRSESEALQAQRERVSRIQSRMDAVRQEIAVLVRDKVDLASALESLGAAERAIQTQALDDAERHVAAAEGLVNGMKSALRTQAAERLERIRRRVEAAREEGLLTPELEQQLADAEAAMAEGRSKRVLELATALEEVLDARRKEKLAADQRTAMEKARTAASRFITVKRLIEDLRKADIEVAGAEEALKASERALQEKAYEKVDEILADLDATAKELMTELTSAARTLIDRADRRIHDARAAGIDVDEARSTLAKAELHFEHGDFDDSVEYARAAEKRVQEALAKMEDAREEETRAIMESARAEITALKKVIADLGRADISIMNADGAMQRAESAFEAGRYEEVLGELDEVRDMADSLTVGLEAAAKDLVATAGREIEAAKKDGLTSPRAELVLGNAMDAIRDRRFVEAIEYRKVIEDILDEQRQHRTAATLHDSMKELRARIDAHAKLGADVRLASELLAKAEARAGKESLEDLQDTVEQVTVAIEAGRKAHLGVLIESLGPLIEEGRKLGVPAEELDELRTHASEAAVSDDLEEVYRIKGDLQERILDAKGRAVLRKAMDEVQVLEDQLVQSERIGVPIGAARAQLDAARRAIEAGDAATFQRGVVDARETLDASRRQHLTQRYDTRVRGVSVMIADAKRLGAEVGEAERTMKDAEEAIRTNELAMADILVKQAEVAVGIQIQNFIKNRYPNLVLRLPSAGLQANVWNRYSFEVENRGKLPARNVEFTFGGSVEAKGATPIQELGVEETRVVEIGLKPTADGAVPMEIGVGYQRMFDENRYELRDTKDLKVEPQGTYLVEDVFLIHSDGRLITHQSRKFREAIDEDIFSGMLTVVQDFIKDSFRRSRTALKRLEFGDSTILIERSPHTYLAAVLIGEEPKLLPLYMIEILKEVEDRFGGILERWTGMLHTLEGIDEVVGKLIHVATRSDADMGALADSPVTLTARVIDALGVEQTLEINELLKEAQSTLETDIRLSWDFIEKAKAQAEAARTHLEDRMKELLAAARDTVSEMLAIGADTSQAELLLREAEEAMAEGKYERVREIRDGLHESVERAKGELAAKKMEVELASLINDIQVARSQSLDVREAESYLTKIEGAIQRKNHRQMEEYLKRAKDSLARQRRRNVMDMAREDLARLQTTLADAKVVHVDLGDVEVLLLKVEEALRDENLKELEPLLDRAESIAKARVEEVMRERYPRLFLEPSHSGLQANRWNRFTLNVTNKGNWPAKDVTPTVLGPVDVQGLHPIPSVDPNEKVSLEFGVRPREAGTMDLDFEVHYTRPLDDAKHQVTDTTSVRVEPEGGYAVEDAILLHESGVVICHESRAYRAGDEAAKAATLEGEAKALVTKAFPQGAGKGIRRATMGDRGLVAGRGPHMFLVLVDAGPEPKALPLYMVQSIKEIHEAYGLRIESWDGHPEALAGIGDLVRKILFATDAPGVSLGPLEDTPVSRIAVLTERGLLEAPDGKDFLGWARNIVETSSYDEGFDILDQVAHAGAAPAEEISAQIQQAVLASKEAGALQLSDEQVAAYVDVLRRCLEAVFQAKARGRIQRYWPLSRIAIKVADPLGLDAVSAFRKIIVGQSGAKELDIIGPNESWRGMKIDINVHMDSVSAAYKLWAKKIEILLRSQDSWKIKAGLEKGEYSVGIEGQKVRIDPSMVSFVESVPEHVVEEPFAGGIVYLDTRMSKELLAEGYAREIVNLVKETRRDLKLAEDRIVQLDIVAGEKLRGMLKPHRDLIMREANALEIRFSKEAPPDAYVIETTLGEDSFYLAIRTAKM